MLLMVVSKSGVSLGVSVIGRLLVEWFCRVVCIPARMFVFFVLMRKLEQERSLR